MRKRNEAKVKEAVQECINAREEHFWLLVESRDEALISEAWDRFEQAQIRLGIAMGL